MQDVDGKKAMRKIWEDFDKSSKYNCFPTYFFPWVLKQPLVCNRWHPLQKALVFVVSNFLSFPFIPF